MSHVVQAKVEGVYVHRVSGAEKQSDVKSSFIFQVTIRFSSAGM
jgi:hypothetical protein